MTKIIKSALTIFTISGYMILAACSGGGSGFVPNYEYTCSYFVDSNVGNDANDGLSETSAWKTFGQATFFSRSTGYEPGDAVCFKRGQRFTIRDGSLEAAVAGGSGSTGTRDNFVFYGAYGDSNLAKPRLSTALQINQLSLWENDETLPGTFGVRTEWGILTAGPYTGLYHWPNANGSWQVTGMWEDNKFLRQGVSRDNIGAVETVAKTGDPGTTADVIPADWFYYYNGVGDPENGVYYKPTDGSAPSTHELFLTTKDVIFLIDGTSNIVFKDLAFEYSGRAIGGTAARGVVVEPLHDIAVIDCTFDYMPISIALLSVETAQGVLYDNYNMLFRGNVFNNQRIAIHLHSGNKRAGVKNVEISNNTVDNISLLGEYVAFGKIDVEIFSIQNLVDVVIRGNDIRNGVKEADMVVNQNPDSTTHFGALSRSFGVVAWTAPGITMRNVLIENNFISNVHTGFGIGVAAADTMRNIAMVNNIIINSEYGVKLNAISSDGTYVAAFNTFHNNGINLELGQVKGVTLIGNISSDPVNYHIQAFGFSGTSTVDYNGYTFGSFIIPGAGGNADFDFTSLFAWKANAIIADENSFLTSVSEFVSANPSEPEDFKLINNSSFLDKVVDVTQLFNGDFGALISKDYGGQNRRVGGFSDYGAWEHQ